MEKQASNRAFWRQGDIFFVKLEEEPKTDGGTALKNGVIARRETTGHAHRVAKPSLAAGAALYLLGREMYLRSPAPGATIVHDEHKPIQLPAGVCAVVHQREFNGLRWRQVVD